MNYQDFRMFLSLILTAFLIDLLVFADSTSNSKKRIYAFLLMIAFMSQWILLIISII